MLRQPIPFCWALDLGDGIDNSCFLVSLTLLFQFHIRLMPLDVLFSGVLPLCDHHAEISCNLLGHYSPIAQKCSMCRPYYEACLCNHSVFQSLMDSSHSEPLIVFIPLLSNVTYVLFMGFGVCGVRLLIADMISLPS